jgi:hypothetical protein
LRFRKDGVRLLIDPDEFNAAQLAAITGQAVPVFIRDRHPPPAGDLGGDARPGAAVDPRRGGGRRGGRRGPSGGLAAKRLGIGNSALNKALQAQEEKARHPRTINSGRQDALSGRVWPWQSRCGEFPKMTVRWQVDGVGRTWLIAADIGVVRSARTYAGARSDGWWFLPAWLPDREEFDVGPFGSKALAIAAAERLSEASRK